MRTILTYGTFDLFHVGHSRLLQRARALGDRLIVGVSTDEFNHSKGKTAVTPFSERVEILMACRWVDEVIGENSWDQKQRDIINYNVNTFVMGNDWEGVFDNLSSLCKIKYLQRTPDISTTQIKTQISDVVAIKFITNMDTSFLNL